MIKGRINLFLLIGLVVLIFSANACGALERTRADDSEQSLTVNSADPEISAALKLIKKIPDSPLGFNQLAGLYIRRARETGDFGLNSKAEESVNRALELKPENLDSLKLKASLHLTFHRFQEAKELAVKLQSQNPQDAFLYGVLTDANVELGNYEEAAEAAQKMVDLRPDMSSYSRVSNVRSLYGDTQGAIEAMRLAAQTADPKDKEAQSWCLARLGEEYFKAGQYKEAEAAYDEALEIFPEYYPALAGKAKTRAAFSDYENAVKFYAQAQNRAPLTDTVIALGDLYKIMGSEAKANEQYNLAEIIEQKLGLNNDRRRLALLWADRGIKLDEALAIATREYAARKDIYTADIYAWCLYKKGQFQEAKVAINEAMRLKNKDARIFYHAGMIEKGLGNKREAIKFLRLALRTNAAFDILQAENAKKALQELK